MESRLSPAAVRAEQLRCELGRVASLRALAAAGVTREERLAHIRAGRWGDIPSRGVVTDLGALSGPDLWSRSLVEVGPQARLGGVTALEADGLVGFDEPVAHIWVPKGKEKSTPRSPRIRLHETRRWDAADACPGALPRSRPDVATVQGALWAKTLRQAGLVMVMPIQQRLVRIEDVAAVLERVRRHPFRRGLIAVVNEIRGGSHSLNEIDFARMCRARGLPEPERQVVRRNPEGRQYIDVRWPCGVSAEINGAQHDRLVQMLSDEVRMIDRQLEGDAVVVISVITLHVDPDPVFDRLARLLRARGAAFPS